MNFCRAKPKERDRQASLMGVGIVTDGQRRGETGDKLAMDRQAEREQKKGRDKDKDISHVLWSFSPSSPTARGP